MELPTEFMSGRPHKRGDSLIKKPSVSACLKMNPERPAWRISQRQQSKFCILTLIGTAQSYCRELTEVMQVGKYLLGNLQYHSDFTCISHNPCVHKDVDCISPL